MKPNYDTLRKIVGEAAYKPGWIMYIEDEDGDLRLVLVDTKCMDAYNSTERKPLAHYHPVPPAFYTEASWKRWIFEQCRRTENHEIGEWLRWGNDRPFAPLHGPGEDPYTVHEFRDAHDAFVTQDGSIRSKSTK